MLSNPTPTVVKNVKPQGNIPSYLSDKGFMEMDILNDELLNNDHSSNVNEEDFFVSDFKM
jgi:hypothetical protein